MKFHVSGDVEKENKFSVGTSVIYFGSVDFFLFGIRCD